ncbi:hypothetical protein AYL99_01169 [Fonsecaea erecta]|uniref:Cytochrome c oxidase assembly protein subunit 15 n=1 Tax=Fonsecaea erecta TaxID=1367422 RepID=A0A178ZZL9_9EURO|nr:hypothetical protein AYL99_01169 [Fonsecaea erecta]OAP65197.1 hypothetical protein AYL99_01169 [Fonsecaea erecta]
MGCCGGEREKFGNLREEQKWDYINLDDFKSSSCWTPFAYGYLLLMLVVSISVYAVDTFTAINLLAFDRWAGQIKPEIPLNISRWIFAGCIILSFVLLVYRWMRAVRVMRQGGVAKTYLDPLAVRIQSIRWGKARGWKRFLVFAELTKSRKGADYVALFAYFSFEAWLRIVFAEGPRQVVNAITLYSVLRLKLVPEGEHAPSDGHSPVVQFFVNVGILADSNHLQAVILFGMLWTLVIWVISVISLIISVILYLVFLWHHIPTEDGGLTGYCRNKINRRMERVVKIKVDKALKKENALRARAEARAAREGTADMKKQPTLPNIGDADDDFLSPLSRQTTMTTLPEYSSRPATSRSSDDAIPTLPDIAPRPPMPTRTLTHGSAASWSSYSSNAPLVGSAADMGFGADRVQTPASELNSPWYGRQAPNRSISNLSQPPPRSFSPALPRPGTAQSDRNGPDALVREFSQSANAKAAGTADEGTDPKRQGKDAGETGNQSKSKSSFPDTSSNTVAYWLLGSAASVFGIVVFGGLTRLTESGLSITEWKPVTGSLPPMSDADWESEFAKYRSSPEFHMLNSRMTLEEFKSIYWMEWIHRLWGRFIGLSFVLPAAYFVARKQVSRSMAMRLLGIAGLIGFQGFIGWWMVKSGLKDDLFAPGSHPRVSQYRLTAHLGAAFVCYLAMLWNGLDILRTNKLLRVSPDAANATLKTLSNPALKPFKRYVSLLAGLVFLTAMSGGLVAGLDAGLIYNEFPYMGLGLTPPRSELWDKFYCRAPDHSDLWWRNLLENPSLVQLDHRILATTTFTAVMALWAFSRSVAMQKILPRAAQKGVHGVVGFVSLQVILGISTLLYLVPTGLASAHQAGSLALLTWTIVLGSRVWFPTQAARILAQRAQTNLGGSGAELAQRAALASSAAKARTVMPGSPTALAAMGFMPVVTAVGFELSSKSQATVAKQLSARKTEQQAISGV